MKRLFFVFSFVLCMGCCDSIVFDKGSLIVDQAKKVELTDSQYQYHIVDGSFFGFYIYSNKKFNVGDVLSIDKIELEWTDKETK